MPRKATKLSKCQRELICERVKCLERLEKSEENCETLAETRSNYRTFVEHESHLTKVTNNKVQLRTFVPLEQRENRLTEFRKFQEQLLAFTPKQRQRMRLEIARMRMSRYRASETPSQRAIRLEKDRERKAIRRSHETQKQRNKRLKIERERKALLRRSKAEIKQECILVTPRQSISSNLSRANETPEQRKKRYAIERERKAQYRASESPEQREIRLEAERKLKALRRKANAAALQKGPNETPEQQQLIWAEFEERRAQVIAWKRDSLQRVSSSATRLTAVNKPSKAPLCATTSPEQEEKRLEADRKRKALQRALETPEQREIRLEAERKVKALRRKANAAAQLKSADETPEQQQLRWAEFEESKAQILAWKREALQRVSSSATRLAEVENPSRAPLRATATLDQEDKRLIAYQKRNAQMRASETPEQSEIHSEAKRKLQALKRKVNAAARRKCANETPEQQQLRLAEFEECRAQLLTWKQDALQRLALSGTQQTQVEYPKETRQTQVENPKERSNLAVIKTPGKHTYQNKKRKGIPKHKHSCLQYLPGLSSTSQDPAKDDKSSLKIEVGPIDETRTIEVPIVSTVVNPSTSVKMEAEEVIPDVTIKNEIDIEEERLVKTEVPDYLNTPTNIKTSESTQITIKIEPESEPKDNTYLVERDDIVDKPRRVETFVANNMPVNIKQENVEPMVSYDYPNFDDGGSMDSSEAVALANVETCLQDDVNIKTENGVHLEDSHNEEFLSTEVKMESETTAEQNSSIQITPDIPDTQKYSFVMKIPGDVMSNIDQIVSSSCLNDSDPDNVDYEAYLDRETPSEHVDNKLSKDLLHCTGESTSLLVESDKSETIGNVIKTIQCPKCPKKFSSKYYLKSHLKVHQTIENYRSGWKRGLETKRKNTFKKRLRKQPSQRPDAHGPQETCSSYQTMTVENKEGYKCTCGKTFQRRTRMESCLRSHDRGNPQDSTSKGSFDCATDTTTFLEEPNQSETIDSNSFQLNSITGNFLSLEQEAYNMMKHKEIIQCPKCTKTFYTKYKLKKHLKVHHTVLNYKNGLKRGLDAKKNKKLQSLLHQTDEHESQDSCSNQQDIKAESKEGYKCTCGKTFQRKTRMETCLRSHDSCESEKYYCMTCLKDFKSKDELALHRKRLHRKKFSCKFCPTDYATRKKLFKHLQIHQKVDQMEYKVIEEVVKEKKKLSCLLCSKFYEDISELKIHVMTEHKGPYSCPHCKNTFPKINDFGNHTKTYHPEVGGQKVLDVIEAFSRLTQEWKCDECGLQFLEADKLALHQVEEHNPELKSEQQFQCSDCRRVFNSQKGLTSHRRIHHSTETTEQAKVEVPGILCLECRKMCKDMAALTSHMRFHSPDRKYPCKFCDFRFATPEKRKTHAEIHTGEMKYVCFICEYQCSSENRLKKHKHSLKHANMREYLLTGKPLIEESTSKDKEKKEAKKGNSSKEVESDSSVSNSDNEDVSCDICGEKFPSETEMLAHKETHPFIEIPNADNKPTRIFFK